MPPWIRFVVIACGIAAHATAAQAALLSLTVIGGVTAVDGSTVLPEPLAQESLSGSTLTQLGTPLLFDPDITGTLSLTARLTNISEFDIAFPDALPGVSVLSGVSGVSGYSARQNVAAGGAGKLGGAGAEGAISRTVIDLTDSLHAASSPASGPYGGGGGAATGIADNWIAITGASGMELAPYLAGLTLRPGEWVDISGIVRITAFQRTSESARIAFGFDLPTFSFGGIIVTTGAWTGAFGGPAPPGEEPPAEPTPTADEGGSIPLVVLGLAVALGGAGGRRARALLDRGEDLAGERG